MQEFINRSPSVKTKCIFFCVEEQKGLPHHLEGLRVRVPQFGNHCVKRSPVFAARTFTFSIAVQLIASNTFSSLFITIRKNYLSNFFSFHVQVQNIHSEQTLLYFQVW